MELNNHSPPALLESQRPYQAEQFFRGLARERTWSLLSSNCRPGQAAGVILAFQTISLKKLENCASDPLQPSWECNWLSPAAPGRPPWCQPRCWSSPPHSLAAPISRTVAITMTNTTASYWSILHSSTALVVCLSTTLRRVGFASGLCWEYLKCIARWFSMECKSCTRSKARRGCQQKFPLWSHGAASQVSNKLVHADVTFSDVFYGRIC